METQSSGIGLSGFLFLVFLVLKLIGKIHWSWIWVFAPLWIPLAIVLLIVVLGVVASVIVVLLGR